MPSLVTLSFSTLTALKTVSAFIGEKVVTKDGVVMDAIGKLADHIAGAAKKDLALFQISISLPTVLVGFKSGT